MNERLAQTVDIETPELVVVSYTIAGFGSRVYAGLIDLVICFTTFFVVILGLSAVGSDTGSRMAGAKSMAVAIAIVVMLQFAVIWGYYLLFEGLRDGQTPGKKMLGLRVVKDGGYSIDFSASAVRNLMRVIDLQPLFTYGIGISSIAFSKSGKRLGDMVAGTLVVRETIGRQPVRPPQPRESASTVAGAVARLDDHEFELLARWADRRASLGTDRRRALTTQVMQRLAHAVNPGDSASESARLLRLLEEERLARQRGAAARGATGASRERYAIVATSSPRWIAFASRLADAQRKGLGSLGESGVRAFVAEYRALSADLARLRTAERGTTSEELFYLGRLVAGAHNLIYRDQRSTLRDGLRFLAVDVPTEVRRSVRPIALAAAFLFGPAVIAYTAVVRDPSVASVFIPVQMLDRAQDGVQRAKNGDGYIEDPQVFRPVMASSIIANNVQVTISAFAAGITAGLGTLFLLVMNGISLGGVFGLYASKGILPLLVAFVAPHGVLELTAICIGSAGGLLIGAALLIPGARTRRRALAENGRRAMILMAAAVIMLVVAGSIEGMISPIPYWPVSLKLIVSATTLVFLVVYLRGGTGSQQRARLDLEVSVDDGGGHPLGRNVENGDTGAPHARERLLSLSD